jgi:peptidoglycan/LPS O-acetylase OafA/YrhL
LNYLTFPQVVVNGVAWSLAIEMTFYTMAFFALTWLKVRPFTACAGLVTLQILIVLTSHMFGPAYFLFAASVTYVPYLLAGQALYFVWAGRISMAQFTLLTAYIFFAVLLGIQMIQTRFYNAAESYGVSFLYAYLVFVVCLLAARWIKTPPVMEFFARISYSLYLVHGPIGFLVLAALIPIAGFTAAITVALAAVIVVSALMFRFVEYPSQRFARWILHRTAGEPAARAAQQRAAVQSEAGARS